MGTTNKFYSEPMTIVPPPPSKFTLNEWYLNNRLRYRNSLDQQQLADKVLIECKRQIGVIEECTLTNKLGVDHKTEERIKDIEFVYSEISRQRKEVSLEIENISTSGDCIMNALASIKTQALQICRKCIIFREGRVGIDLCFDDVDRELHKESDIIESAQQLLTRALEQVNEQIRLLRSITYLMDRDLEDKNNVLLSDKRNLVINQNSLCLSMYHGFAPLDPAIISAEEWQSFTYARIDKAAKEINSARLLQILIDNLIKQVNEDLENQCNLVNEAFRRRIEETKEAKTALEVHHREITRQINEMSRNILVIEKKLSESEGFMALSHTRLGNRCGRSGIEMCKDLVETYLVNEVRELRDNCFTLQHALAEAQASLRYLLKTQIQLEEDINVKTNTLKIDEVDCMTLRQSLVYK